MGPNHVCQMLPVAFRDPENGDVGLLVDDVVDDALEELWHAQQSYADSSPIDFRHAVMLAAGQSRENGPRGTNSIQVKI